MRKLTFALLAGALALFIPVAAHAQTSYDDVSDGTTAGGKGTITLGPFDPNTPVTGILRSDPINLGTVMSNAQGYATFNFTVPANFSGSHHVEATGKVNGQTVTLSSPTFTVKPASSAQGSTVNNNGSTAYARTGANSNTVPMAIGGASAVVVGAGLVAVAKRRRTVSPVAA